MGQKNILLHAQRTFSSMPNNQKWKNVTDPTSKDRKKNLRETFEEAKMNTREMVGRELVWRSEDKCT